MLMKIGRLQNCDALPNIQMSTPDRFFELLESQKNKQLCNWFGELYLELHNGTYTSQRQVKWSNAECENALRLSEFVLACALMITNNNTQTASAGYIEQLFQDAVELERLWKLVLLNQFHDVIPGSCIALVYEDVHRIYKEVFDGVRNITLRHLRHIVKSDDAATPNFTVITNPTSWPLLIHTTTSQDLMIAEPYSISSRVVDAQSLQFSPRIDTIKMPDGSVKLTNAFITALLDKSGRLVSLISNSDPLSRNSVSHGACGAQFTLYNDVPLFWDAWDIMDYNWETRQEIEQLLDYELLESLHEVLTVSNKHVKVFECRMRITKLSSITQQIRIFSYLPYLSFHTKVDWHECHTLLRIEFPTSITPSEHLSTHSIQHGHITRPCHVNTSWDWAKHEVCSHTWLELHEYNYGLAIMKHAIFGTAVRGSCVHLSLLRSPKSPDPNADMGEHAELSYGVMVYAGQSFQKAEVIRYAQQFPYRLNMDGITTSTTDTSLQNIVQNEELCRLFGFLNNIDSGIVIDSVKPVLSGNTKWKKSFLLRLYESFGGSASVKLGFKFQPAVCSLVNCLEEFITNIPVEKNNCTISKASSTMVQCGETAFSCYVQLKFKPFEIKSIIVEFA